MILLLLLQRLRFQFNIIGQQGVNPEGVVRLESFLSPNQEPLAELVQGVLCLIVVQWFLLTAGTDRV